MTPDENVAYLEEIARKVATSAPPCADAMGEVHYKHLTRITLVRSGAHRPMAPADKTYPPAAPEGSPPMVMTAHLRRSVTHVAGARGGTTASSIVGPHVIYAATLEYGAVHTGNMWLWRRFIGYREVLRRDWVRTQVDIRPHPYMRPSRDAVIADGSVVRAANEAFMAYVWGM